MVDLLYDAFSIFSYLSGLLKANQINIPQYLLLLENITFVFPAAVEYLLWLYFLLTYNWLLKSVSEN